MSAIGDAESLAEPITHDHQAVYIYTPGSHQDEVPQRPTKRRKTTGRKKSTRTEVENPSQEKSKYFTSLLNEAESPACVAIREQLFERSWAAAEERINKIINESNEGTLAEITSFVQRKIPDEEHRKLPAGFIVTGPNIASQGHLFKQLSRVVKVEALGPIVTLRSEDAPTLKSTLKKIIKDTTNQRGQDDDEEAAFEQDGRKYLNYDLGILHTYVKAQGSQWVVIALQDSEAFDTTLLADLIILMSSWRDRIPFVLLFGVATSVSIFHERLSRAASRCIYGAQFDVEQISSILETLFLKVIANPDARLRLGPGLVNATIDRQRDHVQSVQVFVAALKYAYMCHFYANALSILLLSPDDNLGDVQELLQKEHYDAIRALPSFQRHIKTLVSGGEVDRAKKLLDNNELLWLEIESTLRVKDDSVLKAIRAMQLVSSLKVVSQNKIEVYAQASTGGLTDSETIREIVNTIKKAAPTKLVSVTDSILQAAENGSYELGLEPWTADEKDFVQDILEIREATKLLTEEVSGKPIRSRYTAHQKMMRTTIIVQKVQLSQDKAALTELDKTYTKLIDRLIQNLEDFIDYDKPQELFLSEVWLYDSKRPYQDVFTPRPRTAIERALSRPHDYLGCKCCDPSIDGSSLSHPPTAILYEMYLSAGSLINVSDLLTAFLGALSGDDGEEIGEREGLMLFYRALADLKMLGMVKQSRKKGDHLAKLAWKGL